MRAGACTVQQTLTLEAASVLKHSLSLARRRGHAQVTPLHVAATLLGYRASLLRRACLRSHPHPTSHPLQCRALELCFNVALNRLPTIPGPVLHGQPSLSNALVAALKRAQAHQRRGCIEQQQQQPLLAIKVELEQLIISILDDPSVSRVMREAGFSSTCVKNNLEDSSVSSLFQCYSSAGVLLPSSSPTAEPTRSDIISHSGFWQTHFLNSSTDQSSRLYPTPKKHFTSTPLMDSDTYKAEDLRLVLEVLLSKKRRNNTVIVGDCVSSTEGLVLELMGRLERGEVPEELRSAHFIKFQLSSVSLLRFIKRDEVETKISDLRRKVSSVSPGGAIIYVGDLKWAVEATHIEKEEVFTVGDVTDYNPVHHVIAEIGRLLYDFSVSNRKVWLMATANYQTYMRCQMKQPPLEVQWSLQAVAVPSGGLALSLHAPSSVDSRVAVLQNPSQTLESVTSNNMDEHEKHICCAECNSNFEKEAGIFNSSQQNSSSLLSCNDLEENDKGPCHLPYWLKQNRTENHPKDFVLELKRKWNRLCQSLHHPRRDQIHLSPSLLNPTVGGKNNSYPSPHPWWSTSLQHNHSNNKVSDLNSISIEAESTSKPNSSFNFVAQLTNEQPQSVEIAVGDGNRKEANAHKHQPSGMSLDSLNKIQNKEAKITFSLGNPLFSDSKTTNQGNRGPIDPQDLCRAMLENVPWQSEIIPSIAEALLDCESNTNKGTWLLIKGSDWMGKRRLARVIAQSYCRTGDKLVHMNMRRKENVVSCVETLMDSLRTGDNCVILVEEIDFSDTNFVEFLAHAFNSGNCKDQIGGRELDFSHAIIILTTNTSTNFDEESNAVIKMQLQVEEMKNWSEVSKNAKRKAEWDLVYPSGNLRTEKKEDPLIVEENTSTKGQFSRQSSSSNLDLNILAEEHEEKELEKPDKCFAVTPDPTNQTLLHHSTAHGFLKLIEKSFIFDRNCFQYSQMSKNFLSKLNNSFEEVYGCERKGWISIDQKLLQEVMDASATFVNSLFEKWLKEVFQKSLLMVQNVQKSVRVRLCPIVGGKQEDILDSGFEGTSLPERIQIVFKD